MKRGEAVGGGGGGGSGGYKLASSVNLPESFSGSWLINRKRIFFSNLHRNQGTVLRRINVSDNLLRNIRY